MTRSRCSAPAIPVLRRHKATDRAYVWTAGKPLYLGRWNSPGADEAYRRFAAEFLATGGRPPAQAAAGCTVAELIAAYLDHADAYYRKPDGTPTGEAESIASALKPLHALYRALPAAEFSPLKLKAVRERLVAAGRVRTSVNQQIRRIRAMFRWAVETELVPANVLHALRAVAGLKAGRSTATESAPVLPVENAHVEAVLGRVLAPVAAMIRLQRLTAMRPGEVVAMTMRQLDRTGEVWRYAPASHKTQHHGRQRVVYLGPRAQAVLGPFLKDDPDAPLFSPAEGMARRRQERHAARKTPLSCGNRSGANRSHCPARNPGRAYTTVSYGHAVAAACKRAGVPTWYPNRLRHAAATEIRRQYGLEAAQVILGHSRADVTQVYAERDETRAAAAMLELG
jgi:integrase